MLKAGYNVFNLLSSWVKNKAIRKKTQINY